MSRIPPEFANTYLQYSNVYSHTMVDWTIVGPIFSLVIVLTNHLLSRRYNRINAKRLSRGYFIVSIAMTIFATGRNVELWYFLTWLPVGSAMVWYAALAQAKEDIDEGNQTA